MIKSTQITMSDGSTKNIESIKVGDILKGYKNDTVTVWKLVWGQCNAYYVINNRLKVTQDHPILLQFNTGNAETIGEWTYEKLVKAKDIQPGDMLSKSDGTAEEVTSITTVSGQNLTFNLVTDANNLFIAEDIVVRGEDS